MTKLGGRVFGSIFAAFPAMFISALAITYKTQRIEYSREMTKPLMVTGMVTIAIYAIAVRYSYSNVELYMGTPLSIFLLAISANFTYRLIQDKCA